MILDFADTDTAQVFAERRPKKYPPDILTRALSKLRLLDAAGQLEDMRVPPGNRLEALHGDRTGQHSVRIKTSGASALSGRKPTKTKAFRSVRGVWRSWITIDQQERPTP